MRKTAITLVVGLSGILPSIAMSAEGQTTNPPVLSVQQSTMQPSQQVVNNSSQQPKKTNSVTPIFTSFTGKVTKNKVRLRAQPSLDSPVLKELSASDMLIVVGEAEDFYAVQPPQGIKAYVFRTYILDNTVEASKVNVRLEPDLEAPVLAQLQQGDHVNGIISPLNNKWLEISPPASARFYVAKDYIENIGDPSVMSKLEKRRDDVNILLNSTYLTSQKELQKPFPEIALDNVYSNLNKIINDYRDFPEQVSRSKELLSTIQDNYLQKKIVFLETKTKTVQDDWESKNTQLSEQMKNQQKKVSLLEQQLKKTNVAGTQDSTTSSTPSLSNKMSAWQPAESSLFTTWIQSHPGLDQNDFYQEQADQSVALRGILEPYNRVIKNKPGDYILVNQSTHLPVAYLYSTQVNLQDRLGHEVTVYGSPRDNRNFAFPAYYVLSIE